jgi:hypothetical protein
MSNTLSLEKPIDGFIITLLLSLQGVVVRLNTPDSEILRELKTFIASDSFNKALAQKFDVKLESCSKDAGIQKYLDGYEISPHPDVRKKALTFMVNINTLRKVRRKRLPHALFKLYRRTKICVGILERQSAGRAMLGSLALVSFSKATES